MVSSFRSITLILCVVSAPFQALGTPYFFGLDFLDEPTPSPAPFFEDFEPFPLTTPANHFVLQGALAGVSESTARRAVALAVERTFEAIDIAEAGRRLALGIHLGAVPEEFSGRRLNVALGQSSLSTSALGVTPRPGDYFNLDAQDTIVAAVWVDNIDGLGATSLVYDDFDDAVNSVAGTTAHEIGHVFGLEHVDGNSPLPWPVMAVGSTGLPTAARLTERRFSTSQPASGGNAQALVDLLGTRARGDFNLDYDVDQLDLAVLLANLGQEDRLALEGDANGDQRVDGADAAWLIANWNAAPLLAGLSHSSASASLIPEPAAAAVACGFAGFWIIAARRGRKQTRSAPNV